MLSARFVTAFLLFSTIVLSTVAANAQIQSNAQIPRSQDWINIKDPRFGAVGDGSHDDTAAIQAAIDYAYANNLPTVYCPAGNYSTTSTIYLDAPGNLRTNYVSPTIFNFTLAFFGDPMGGGWDHLYGCQIQPNFNNSVAFMVGTGQSMRMSNVKIAGPGNGYHGNLNASGVGVGIAGGNGGASSTLIDNVYVENFYTLYETDANGACCLSDNNTFRKDGGQNGYYGFNIQGSQAYINHIIDPQLEGVTVGVNGEYNAVKVDGGMFTGGAAQQSGSFSISGTSALFTGGSCTGVPGQTQCFTTTIASPDIYIPNVYNAYTIATAHYGVVPLQLVAWDAGTNTAIFTFWYPWVAANYGISSNFGYFNEVSTATTLYAAEQVSVARGIGIDLEQMHVEDYGCTALMGLANLWGAQVSSKIVEPYFNYDMSLASTSASLAHKYCQQAFPFLGGEVERFNWVSHGNNAYARFSLDVSGGNWGLSTTPLLIDISPSTDISGERLSNAWFNLRLFEQTGNPYHELGQVYGYNRASGPSGSQFATEARGTGRWDNDYFLPPVAVGAAAPYPFVLRGFAQQSELTSDYCGYEPCPWTTPNLSPTVFSYVCPGTIGGGASVGAAITCSGSLGALGTYPPIACRTVYKSVDWNSAAIATPLYRRSASCPGYSWGQNLTDATVGETVTWSYQAGSDVLYVDGAIDGGSMSFMFPGLGISIDNGSGAEPYIVTGVYPSLGYVTVMWASTNNGGQLQGTAGTNYSCSTSCTIGQAPFAWGAY